MTPAALREHFEQNKGPGGTLTDVKVLPSLMGPLNVLVLLDIKPTMRHWLKGGPGSEFGT